MTEVGLMIHVGLYSIPCFDDIQSLRRRKMKNGSEWYLKRLTCDLSGYRPISGSSSVQKHHKDNYGEMDYYEFKNQYTLENFKPMKICEMISKIGMKYIVITSKHHDGFCNWPTKSTNPKKSLERDLLREFKEASLFYGLKFGIYYSWMEFDSRITNKYLEKILVPQMEELMKYNPDIWWFDGHWDIKTKCSITIINGLLKKILELNPNVEINDRVPDLKYCTFKNFSDRFLH